MCLLLINVLRLLVVMFDRVTDGVMSDQAGGDTIVFLFVLMRAMLLG